MLLAAPFVFGTPERLLPFGVAIVVEFLAALAICYVFPTAVPAVSHDPSGVIGSIRWLADTIRLGGNAFPSMPVALSASAALGCAPQLTTGSRMAVFGLAGVIAVSALLTHQNVVADVVGGLALAALGMGLVYPRAQRALEGTRAWLGSSVGNTQR